MEGLFVKLLNMSISASILILAVLLLRLVLKKAPRWIVCVLWALVAVRLICPFNLTSPFSIYKIIDPPVTESGQIEYVHFVGENVRPLAVIDRNDYGILKAPENAGNAKKHNPDLYLTPIVYIWIGGMSLILLYAVFSAVRLKLSLRTSVRLSGNIYLSDNVKSPFIFGIIRPRIYLGSGIPEEQMEYVIEHEQAHLKRGDHFWKPLGYLLLSIYWFNPLCWVAYILLCRDIELACDEKVIRDKDLEWKKSYSMTLLECSMYKRHVMACPLAFGEVGVKTRVKQVLNYKKPAFWIILVAVAACIVAAVCFLTNPGIKEKRNEKDMQSENDGNLVADSSEGTANVSAGADGNVNITGSENGEGEDGQRDIVSAKLDSLIKIGDYGEHAYLNFDCALFEHEDYIAPDCGDGTPDTWIALGGVGTSFDPESAANFEEFENGSLVAYGYEDNHMTSSKIATFREGEISGCLYKQAVDLFTAPEIEGFNPAKTVQEFWAVFYTEGEGKPLYLAFYNCDYFTYAEALENTGIYGDNSAYTGAGHPDVETTTYEGFITDGTIDFKEPTIMVDVSGQGREFNVLCCKLGEFADKQEWKNGLTVRVTCLNDITYYDSYVSNVPGMATATLVDIEPLSNNSNEQGNPNDSQSIMKPGDSTEDENLSVSYEMSADGKYYVVDRDMVFKYKKTLIGQDPNADQRYKAKFIVLTNNPDVTWWEVHKSLYSSNTADFLKDTVLIGITTIEAE